MTVSYDSWDYATLLPGKFDVELYGRSYEGGKNVLGISYGVNYAAGGCWKITYKSINLFDPAQHRAWLKAAALLNGGTTPINVFAPARRTNPYPTGTPDMQPTIDQSPAIIKAQAGDGAAVYASTIKIRILAGTALLAGHMFSVNHVVEGWRLYLIKEVGTSTDGPTTDTDAIIYNGVKIVPPLREGIHEGQVLEFDWPRVAMRLATGQTMPWSVQDWWSGSPDVSFVEYFVRT